MSKDLLESNFFVFWRTNLHDPTVFKQPGQYVHFTLWKCHFWNLGFKTGFKQSPLKTFLCWKKICRVKFLNSYDIRYSLRPKNDDSILSYWYPNKQCAMSVGQRYSHLSNKWAASIIDFSVFASPASLIHFDL